MKARKLTMSKMAARFLWMRLLGHQYDTAETRKIAPVFDELEKLRAFDNRISDRLSEETDGDALQAASQEIDQWEETWADFSFLVSPEAFDLAKERWDQIPKVNEQGMQVGLQDAKFAPQQRKMVIEVADAFDKAEHVDVTEKTKEVEQCR